MDAIFYGLANGLSFLVVIGAQNAFILKQGLKREHVFILCLTCALSDALLIAFGVTGFHIVLQSQPWIEPLMRWGGGLFLLWYGGKSALAAYRANGNMELGSTQKISLTSAVLTCLALTWLNPHVYLDTVVLLGTVSTQFAPHQYLFGLGAVMGSFLFFFCLGFGARFLRPIFNNSRSWQILDSIIALIMWAIAIKLLFF